MTSSYDSTGATLDRYVDTLARLVALAEDKWGESIDTSEDEFLGHIIRNITLLVSETNEILQSVYDAMSVANASGVPLRNLLALVGIDAQGATYSTVTLTLTATKAATVTTGTQYKTEAGVIFATDEALVFTAAGSDDVDATCTVTGPYDAAIGEVNTIVNPVDGISTVTNAAAATPGKNADTDAELKVQHTSAVSTSGTSSAAEIKEAVGDVTGVDDVYIYDNDTDETATDGTPSGYIHVSVIGGDSDDIAEAIALSKTSGVPTHGAQTVSWYDEDTSQAKDIKYDIAVNVPVYIDVDVTSIVGLWPENGAELMSDYLVAHLAEFHIGDDLAYNSLYKPVYSVPGGIITDLFVDTSALPAATADITATALQRLTLVAANINITVI